jgi:hypothetical protein
MNSKLLAPATARRTWLALCAAALLAGCAAPITHVTSGEVVLRERLAVQVQRSWNQFNRGMAGDNVPTWTQEGVTVDALRFYVGLKDGELIAPTPSQPKGTVPLAFKRGMQATEVAGLFEGLYSRGGSTFTLDKIEPASFMGQPGFRFEFSSIRKYDEVRLRGVAWGAVHQGELFLISYTAPRLAFFARGLAEAEAIAGSARLKS